MLIYGYGNPGRFDDGLGPLFVEHMQKWVREEGLSHIDFETNYQLNIEDAELISGYKEVLFVDASVEEFEGYKIEELSPDNSKIEFSMHAVSPAFVLDLCQKMFGKNPKVQVLHIKGCEWKFDVGLSEPAKNNLEQAKNFIMKQLSNPIF